MIKQFLGLLRIQTFDYHNLSLTYDIIRKNSNLCMLSTMPKLSCYNHIIRQDGDKNVHILSPTLKKEMMRPHRLTTLYFGKGQTVGPSGSLTSFSRLTYYNVVT